MTLLSRYILGMRVDATSYEDASRRVILKARSGESDYVCVSTVHMVMEAHDAAAFQEIVNGAYLVVPDGRPLVWALSALGAKGTQVRGTPLMTHVVERAAREGVSIGLYGGTPELLQKLTEVLKKRHPRIQVVCKIAPPFRELTSEEDEEATKELVASGAQIVFVGIGCPKQEKWMAAHRDRIPAVMLGVGAAFDFHTGRIRQAPSWVQVAGLEWFYRLLMDPRRLWKRYAKHNPRFVALFLAQLLGNKLLHTVELQR